MFVRFLFFLILWSGCYIPPHSPHSDRGTSRKYPFIVDALAGCAWNHSYQDYVWYFDAWVDHAYGQQEIEEVWVDVWAGARLVDSFPLYHDRYSYWTSQWREHLETNLWCEDYLLYEVDVFAIDREGDMDSIWLVPAHY